MYKNPYHYRAFGRTYIFYYILDIYYLYIICFFIFLHSIVYVEKQSRKQQFLENEVGEGVR